MQGRVFSARDTLQYTTIPFGLLLGGFLADHVFEPMMAAASPVQAVLAPFFGTGKGAGIAVMGVFNLVRFRSIPGSAKDIGSVFLAMAIGLATGMGFLLLACVFTAVVAVANVAYVLSPFGKQKEPEKTLRITIPEDLEYDCVFDETLARYTDAHELTEVQTTNMGSLFLLEYAVRMKEPGLEKRMIDELRCLNGNLKISLGRAAAVRETL